MQKKRRQVRSQGHAQVAMPWGICHTPIAHYALQVARWLVPHSATVSLTGL